MGSKRKDPGPLLPAPGSPVGDGLAMTELTTKRKRSNLTKVACDPCRIKKLACNGSRPLCSRCQKHGLQCLYMTADESETRTMALKRENDTLRTSLVALEGLVNHLKYMPEDVAKVTLQRLRATSDPPRVLQSIEGDPAGFRPSEHKTAQRILPPIQSGTEFELMAQYPISYPKIAPLEKDTVAEYLLLMPSRIPRTDPSPDPTDPEKPLLTQESLQQIIKVTKSSASMTGDTMPMYGLESSMKRGPNQNVPETVASYWDQRLDHLNIAFWTTVPVTNQLAAGAISLYLETDYPMTGVFDAHLFVGDLVDCKLQFCSPFLVTSLLSLACQAYTSKDPEASARSSDFEQEAKKLWCVERSSDSLTNIAALVLLFNSCACKGEPGLDIRYGIEVLQMAKRMKLFGTPDALTAADLGSLSSEDRSAVSYTAWGAFKIYNLESMFYPTLAIVFPPALPLPGKYAVVDDEDDTVYIEQPSAADSNRTFLSLCTLSAILSEFLSVARGTEAPQAYSLAFALSKFSKLLSWAENLPACMTRGEHNPPHVLQLHIYYHFIVLEIFRPFVATKKQHGFSSWSPSSTLPEAIFAASIRQLKDLMLVYMTRQPSATYSLFWHPAVLYVANAVLKDTIDPEWRFYFMLCFRAYQNLYPCFLVVEGIVQGLLAIAVGNGSIDSAEASVLIQELRARRSGRKSTEGSTGDFLLDMDLATVDRDAALINNLVDRFEEISAFNDFTEGII